MEELNQSLRVGTSTVIGLSFCLSLPKTHYLVFTLTETEAESEENESKKFINLLRPQKIKPENTIL